MLSTSIAGPLPAPSHAFRNVPLFFGPGVCPIRDTTNNLAFSVNIPLMSIAWGKISVLRRDWSGHAWFFGFRARGKSDKSSMCGALPSQSNFQFEKTDSAVVGGSGAAKDGIENSGRAAARGEV